MQQPLVGRSRRYRMGVGFLVAPVVLLTVTLAIWIVAIAGTPPIGLLLPVLTLGFILEIVSGTIGVWLILSSPDVQPWRSS